MTNIDHWLEGKGKIYQSAKYSQQQIKDAYEKYLNESSCGSSTSKETNLVVQKSRPVSKVTHGEKLTE